MSLGFKKVKDKIPRTRITSVKYIQFILAVKFTWATCFDLV